MLPIGVLPIDLEIGAALTYRERELFEAAEAFEGTFLSFSYTFGSVKNVFDEDSPLLPFFFYLYLFFSIISLYFSYLALWIA